MAFPTRNKSLILLCLMASAQAAQIAGGAKPPNPLDLAASDVAARREAWHRAHAAVTAASSNTRDACAPQFGALVRDARDAAARWITSSSRAFDLWAVRRTAAEDSAKPAVLPTHDELAAAQALLERESEALGRRGRELSSTLPLERAAQSATGAIQPSIDAIRSALEAAITASPAVGPAQRSSADLAALQSSIRALQGARTRESELFNALYTAIEREAVRSCEAGKAAPADPFALPPARSGGRSATKSGARK